jgi:hypothetical protein
MVGYAAPRSGSVSHRLLNDIDRILRTISEIHDDAELLVLGLVDLNELDDVRVREDL